MSRNKGIKGINEIALELKEAISIKANSIKSLLELQELNEWCNKITPMLLKQIHCFNPQWQDSIEFQNIFNGDNQCLDK